jgi:uncharacterized protein
MTDKSRYNPLEEKEIDELEAFLFSSRCSEEAMDFVSLHGLLTAIAVAPEDIPVSEWIEQLFDGTPDYASENERERIEALLNREYQGLCMDLYHDEEIQLPCDLSLEQDDEDEDGPLLTFWAQGFMEGVFMREEQWFKDNEEETAELLLPIMLASDLFDDEQMLTMRENSKLCQELCEEIPAIITDLYLQFRVPAEAGGKKKR